MNNCQPNCGCKFEVDSSCVRYTAVNLGTTLINVGDTIETTIIKIDQAITNLQQTIINNNTTGSTLQISGPIDRVVKFGPVSNPLLPSQTIDDGTSIGINANPDSSNKVLIETSSNQSGLKVSSLNNGKEAIIASSQATGSIVNKGIVSLVSGSTISNIGTETSATGASNINVGISSTAIGGTSNYSAQLKDGSETTQGGKFLKDTGSGKAKWNYIYLADIQDYQAPTSFSLPIATNTILGGIKVGNGLSITSQGVLSSNIGQGTLNYIAKFTPDGYSINDSQIIDDGNAIAINTTIDSSSKINISSGLPSAIRIDNTYSGGSSVIYVSSTTAGPGNKEGHFLEVSNGVEQNIGVNSNASGGKKSVGVATGAQNSSVENIGIDAGATGNLNGSETNYGVRASAFSGNKAYGGKFEAKNGAVDSIGIWAISSQASGFNVLNRYSAQLQDGTEGEGKFLKSVTSDGKANWASLVTDVTHAQLVTRVNNSKLTQGTYYRITDYQTIYEQPDFIDMLIPVVTPIIKTGPIQPIIVLALKTNVLSEQAYQENYPSDTIKYQLEYNTKRTTTPTKGRIYERVDEYNNRTDFDHRNVLFKRYSIDPNTIRFGQSHFLSEELNLFHYPVADNCISSEHLIFKDTGSYQYSNNYIGGNFNEGDSYFTYFDLPNIVIGAYYGNTGDNHILKCTDSTFSAIASSSINFVKECTFFKVVSVKISLCNNVTFFTPTLIANSTIERWSSLFICSLYGGEITYSELSNFNGNNSLGLSPYTPFLYTDIGTITFSKIGGFGDIKPLFRRSGLINVRNNSKMYTGNSIFSPSNQYFGIIVKILGSDELVTDDTRLTIDSFGRVSHIDYFGLNTNGGVSTAGPQFGEVKFYFETTTSNEAGKVPSNVIEQVTFSADKCAAPMYTAPTVFYASNVKYISSSSIGQMNKTNIDEINYSKINYIEDSSGTRIFHVTSKTRDCLIRGVTFKNLRDVTYSQIVNCTFNNVTGSNFGFYFGGPSENTSSDSWVFTSNMTSKTGMVTGNIFNSDIINSNFGEYVQGNTFDCEVVNTSIPSYFSNNNVKALAYKYHNINYLNKYKELKELPIKCEIDSYFKTMSEFGFSTTLGSTIPYDKLSIYTKFKVDLKLFRVEPNYISTVPRLWYVFIHQRLDQNPYLYHATEFERNLESSQSQFCTSNPILLNTSTAVGQSKNNTKKLRDTNINSFVGMTYRLDDMINYPTNSVNGFYDISPDLTRMSIPTKEDLELIYSLNLTQSAETVWSSSEVDLGNAWAFNFATGLSEIQPKDTSFKIIYIIDLVGAEALKFSYNTSSGPVVVNIDELT